LKTSIAQTDSPRSNKKPTAEERRALRRQADTPAPPSAGAGSSGPKLTPLRDLVGSGSIPEGEPGAEIAAAAHLEESAPPSAVGRPAASPFKGPWAPMQTAVSIALKKTRQSRHGF